MQQGLRSLNESMQRSVVDVLMIYLYFFWRPFERTPWYDWTNPSMAPKRARGVLTMTGSLPSMVSIRVMRFRCAVLATASHPVLWCFETDHSFSSSSGFNFGPTIPVRCWLRQHTWLYWWRGWSQLMLCQNISMKAFEALVGFYRGLTKPDVFCHAGTKKLFDSLKKNTKKQWPLNSPIYKHWAASTMQGISSLIAKSLAHSGAGIRTNNLTTTDLQLAPLADPQLPKTKKKEKKTPKQNGVILCFSFDWIT